MPRQWVVNASPLIILGKIEQLSILSYMAASVVVSIGVAHKLAAAPESDPACQWLAGPGNHYVSDVGNLERTGYHIGSRSRECATS